MPTLKILNCIFRMMKRFLGICQNEIIAEIWKFNDSENPLHTVFTFIKTVISLIKTSRET